MIGDIASSQMLTGDSVVVNDKTTFEFEDLDNGKLNSEQSEVNFGLLKNEVKI